MVGQVRLFEARQSQVNLEMIFKGVIIVSGIAFCILIGVVLYSGYLEDSENVAHTQSDQTRKISGTARQFIETSPTFSYDGIEESLEIIFVKTIFSNLSFIIRYSNHIVPKTYQSALCDQGEFAGQLDLLFRE